jgi:hypothetical protein
LRAASRESSRLERLTQQINNTKPTAASKTHSERLTSPTTCSVSGMSPAPIPLFSGCRAAIPAITAFKSARACSRVAPGLSRPTMPRK